MMWYFIVFAIFKFYFLTYQMANEYKLRKIVKKQYTFEKIRKNGVEKNMYGVETSRNLISEI